MNLSIFPHNPSFLRYFSILLSLDGPRHPVWVWPGFFANLLATQVEKAILGFISTMENAREPVTPSYVSPLAWVVSSLLGLGVSSADFTIGVLPALAWCRWICGSKVML